MIAQANYDCAIQKLLAVGDFLRGDYDALIEDWSPDTPPITIAFSIFGRSIASACNQLSEERHQRIWSCVEGLMNEDSELVKNAVATGLLEAILSEASAGRLDVRSFATCLGPETVAYCKSWDSFTGVVTDGIS